MVKKYLSGFVRNNDKNITVLILLVVIFILSSFSCSYKRNELVSFNSIFTKVDSLLLSDNNSISQPNDVARLNDSSFVFTDFWTRSIFYFNSKTGEIKKIGRTGRGPGEYIWPDKLLINNGKILFSDFQTRTIQEIDSQGKYYSKIVCNAPIRRFCIDDSLNYFILSSTDYQLLVFNRDGNLTKKLFPVNKKYKYPIFTSHGGGICYDGNGHIFFASVVGDKINKVKIDDLSIVQEVSRKKSPFYKEVPKKIQGDFYLNLETSKRHKLLENINVLLDLYFIDTGKGYIAVSLKNHENVNVVEIRDTNGDLLSTTCLRDNEYPIGCTKDEFYTIKEKSKSDNKDTENTIEFWLNIYHIKDLARD